MITAGNLYADLPATADLLGNEAMTMLLAAPGVRVMRIVSLGAESPPDFWYDEPDVEWVVVLSGRAELVFADETAPRRLGPGDHVLIPAHCRHRVAMTAPDEPTIWLAVHVAGGLSQPSATTRAENGSR